MKWTLAPQEVPADGVHVAIVFTQRQRAQLTSPGQLAHLGKQFGVAQPGAVAQQM